MKNINTKNWVILFSDLKDFTLKTSLLTQKQIDKILDDQDKLMLLNLKKYSWELIKTVWDSYMIFFDTPKNALFFAIEIQKLLKDYNSDKKIPLHKIEIRISIDYGILNKKDTINWCDYFWDSVNLASRVLSRTPETKIFITDKLYWNLIWEAINCRYVFLWKTTFKWILYEVWIYEVLYDEKDIVLFDMWELQKNELLEDERTIKRQKNIDDIIFKCSSINCIISIQPIPFIDIYSSIWFYVYMLNSIASEYKIKLSKKETKEILITIFSAIWSTLIINQIIQWVWKIWLIWIAWFLFIPLNFWITYWIWKVMNYYFYSKSNNLKINNAEIKELFLSWKDYWIKYAKKNKKEIFEIWKKFKKDFFEFQKNSKDNLNKLYLEIKNEIKNLKNK